jgi:hypothetical protein
MIFGDGSTVYLAASLRTKKLVKDTYFFHTPQYSWNTAKVGIKHQSIIDLTEYYKKVETKTGF